MRKEAIATLGLAGILMIAACSSESTEQASVNGNKNTATITNGSEVQTLPVNANEASFTSAEKTNSATNSVKTDGPQKTGVDTATALETARKSAQPAPDNSTFFSFLSDEGHEIRTFKDHPQLLKVEKTTSNDGKQTARIFLRSGKIIEIDGKLIPQLSVAGVQFILERAGIKADSPQVPTGPAGEKKPGE